MERSYKVWNSYYKRNNSLPAPRLTVSFLRMIPENGRILDFGAGSGRWAAAFLRDRQDIVVDVLDQNVECASLLPEDWCGEKIKARFQDFNLNYSYDGIWAFAALFFLNKQELEMCFHELAAALNDGGVMAFTMVDDCLVARNARFYGMASEDIKLLMHKEGLKIISFRLNKNTSYGLDKIKIPTYFMTARKIKP